MADDEDGTWNTLVERHEATGEPYAKIVRTSRFGYDIAIISEDGYEWGRCIVPGVVVGWSAMFRGSAERKARRLIRRYRRQRGWRSVTHTVNLDGSTDDSA